MSEDKEKDSREKLRTDKDREFIDALLAEEAEEEKKAAREQERRQHSMKKREKQEKRQNHLRTGFALTLILIGIALGAFIMHRYMPTGKVMPASDYFMTKINEAGGSGELAEDEIAVVLQDKVSASKAIMVDDHMYLNYDAVRSAVSSRFYWDAQNQVMLCTTGDDTWQIPLDSAAITTAEGEQKYERSIFLSDDTTGGRGTYIDADFLATYVNVEYLIDLKKEHVLVNYNWGSRTAAVVKKKGSVRYAGGIKSMVLTKVKAGDTVYPLEAGETWTKVATADGYIGYIENKRLEESEKISFARDFTDPVTIPSLVQDSPVNLVWHMIDNSDANSYLTDDLKGVSGVNVISPTWLSLSDNEGSVTSLISNKYIKRAHKKNIAVWVLVSNFSPDMSTAELLSTRSRRSALIENLVSKVTDAGADGINVDFEYLTESYAYDFTQFIRELSVATHKAGLVLSVDLPVAHDINTYIDRAEIGRYADYVIIMGYDEHYVGSEAGSVASISFERNGVEGTLKKVPAEKIISAIPFYTRLWYSQTDADGNASVWSEVLGMDSAAATVKTYNVTPTWNEEVGQNYAEWELENEGITCKIWLEDEDSIALKASLVKEYKLGGVAAWALGFQSNSIWDVIAENAGITEVKASNTTETETETKTEVQTEAVSESQEKVTE